MKVTVFREKKDGSGKSVQAVEFNSLIYSIKDSSKAKYISEFRSVYPYLIELSNYSNIKFIPRVCPVSEYYRSKSGEHLFRAYNGVSVIKIAGIGNKLEVEKAKSQCKLLPQVLCSFEGADGHSVITLTLATQPDGSLPKTENEALLFATKAYADSVMCLQPLLDFQIEISAPALDTCFRMTLDETPYVNEHPTPFIIEQPTELTVRQFAENDKVVKPLSKMMPGPETYFTFNKVFNAAYSLALERKGFANDESDEILITKIANVCVETGLPQEEVTQRLCAHFYKMDEKEVRGIVKDAYETNEKPNTSFPMKKHQIAAFKLREFLGRRYEIRLNEVLQMTEFRKRQSLQFLFKELGKRELNSIYHEALLEGIEPTFGEVDTLTHSDFVPKYNPIEDYLDHLPRWDGNDHIGKVIKMVETDNPYWDRLFRQWFLSMVAHWMNTDELHANSTAPILIGEQGYRKSTFCRQLLPPELRQFYTDSLDFRTNVEAERALSRFLLVNIDEFDRLTEKQFAVVKHLFQKPATTIRRMYSEAIGNQRRYASFIGTTNSEDILRDPTGNRRYLCVYVTDKIKTEQSINYSQLYAQAVALITKGERYWLNDEDEKLIKETNQRFEVESPLEQLFLTVFTGISKKERGGEWLRPTEIMDSLSQLKTFDKKKYNDLQGLGKVLTKKNIEKRRSANGTQYYVKRIE